MKIYKQLATIQGEIARVGLAKSNRNAQQGYAFRGIDDVYGLLAPLLAKHGVCMLPRVLSRSVAERTTTKGGALFCVVVDVEFDLVCAEDGTKHTIRTAGEAMDSADKATNKAMSAAYKYAALMAFCIPTEGDNDADATTHDVASTITAEQAAHIRAQVSALEVDEDAMLAEIGKRAGYGIDAIERIPLSAYEWTVGVLEKRRKAGVTGSDS